MNKIIVVGLEKKFEKFEQGVKKEALGILKVLKKDGVAAEIYLADNKLMRKLNKEYRGKDKAANVLSFVEPKNFPHPDMKGRKYLGEIYLNISVKSITYNLPTTNLLIHSFLHLFGYTHKKKSDRIKMEKKENYALNLLRHRNIANQSNHRRSR